LWVMGQMGFGVGAALVAVGTHAFATVAWPNARWYGSEPLSALLLLLFAAFAWRTARLGPGGWNAAGAAAAGGLLVLHTPMAGPLVALVAAAAAWRGLGKGAPRQGRAWGLACAIVLAGALLFFAYNHARTGHVLKTGYEGDHGAAAYPYSGKPGFSTPILVGLYGNLFSSGRGVFFYSPPLVLALGFFGGLWRRERGWALLAAACSVYYLLLWSAWWSWYGGACWGNRALLPVLPLLAPALALGWERARAAGGGAVAAFLAVAAIGVAVQIPGVLVDPADHYRSVIGPRWENEYRIHFVPQDSPLAAHTRILLGRPMARNDLYWWPAPSRDMRGARLAGAGALLAAMLAGAGLCVSGAKRAKPSPFV
ncbi:MAG TPA: hypothetical protein P5137_01655, partial [Candidatus Brocadiia bacterium]|nr:hypothetical protein [Candidatus Brocadiia bacterium]